jgi:hypothetical protein
MRTKNLIFTIFLLSIFTIGMTAQVHNFSFTSGDFQHKVPGLFDQNPSPLGTFRFIASNTDVNGQHGPFGGGTYARCDNGLPRCYPGSVFTFREDINGISSFYHNNTPIVVNGVTYQTAVYNDSSFRADADPIRIPWRYSKRKTFKLTLKVHAVGLLRINSPGPPHNVANGSIDMWGWVTVEFMRDDSGRYPFPEQNYVMTGDVTYYFPPAGS